MYSKSFVPVKTELWFGVLVNGGLNYDSTLQVWSWSTQLSTNNWKKWKVIIDIYVRVVNFEGTKMKREGFVWYDTVYFNWQLLITVYSAPLEGLSFCLPLFARNWTIHVHCIILWLTVCLAHVHGTDFWVIHHITIHSDEMFWTFAAYWLMQDTSCFFSLSPWTRLHVCRNLSQTRFEHVVCCQMIGYEIYI